MTSILIIENQEPGDCAACPLFFRNAGVCSWTMRFGAPCPLQKVISNEDEGDYRLIITEAQHD